MEPFLGTVNSLALCSANHKAAAEAFFQAAIWYYFVLNLIG